MKALNIQEKKIVWLTMDEFHQLDIMSKAWKNTDHRIIEHEDPGVLPALAVELKSGTLRIIADSTDIPYPDERFTQIQHPQNGLWHKIDREKARSVEISKQPFDSLPIIQISDS